MKEPDSDRASLSIDANLIEPDRSNWYAEPVSRDGRTFAPHQVMRGGLPATMRHLMAFELANDQKKTTQQHSDPDEQTIQSLVAMPVPETKCRAQQLQFVQTTALEQNRSSKYFPAGSTAVRKLIRKNR